MFRAKSKYAKQVAQERDMSEFIPFAAHVADDMLITKQGDLVRIWRIDGVAFETAEPDEVLRYKEQLNTLLRSLASDQVAIWSHIIRRKTTDHLNSVFENDFCRDIDKKYYESFAGYKMMANELYFTVIYRPNPDRMGRALARSSKRSTKEILDEQKKSIHRMDEMSYQIEASLKSYGADGSQGIQRMGIYVKDGVRYSNALSFLNYLISGEWQPVRVPNGPLWNYLGHAWVFVGTETIEIRTPSRTRFARGIDFKDYAGHTEAGIINGLMYEDSEYVITQSFSFMSKRKGKEFLTRQQRQLMNAEDGSATQVEEMDVAIDELIQGQFAMGEYHFSMMVFGDDLEQVKKNTTSAVAVIQDAGFLASIITTATDAAFYAQLPCNFSYRPRIAGLTSRNFAGLSCFHNFRTGKRDNNPWGDAVTLLKTQSGQPLYFNFHYSKGDEDSYDRKLLGNTRVIGQSGSGKTVLLNFLLCQSQKYKATSEVGFTTVFFDKDRGAELLIRAIGGQYLAIQNGKPTGLNPFQMDATENNILFLEGLVKILVTTDTAGVTTTDEQRISHAVRTVMRMPREMRRLSVVLQNITEGMEREERENSVARRLEKWCADNGSGKRGILAWALDNPDDQINFNTHTNYGFDGTAFLDNKDVRTPISMYLLHQMNAAIDGRRFIYFMDEAWKWVDDEAFADFAGDKQLTIRKQNGLGVFATQMPSSLLNSKIASALVQQCATEIYLPNPKADYDEYTKGFKLTPTEFEVVKNLAEEGRMFLVKQGHQSMLAKLDLGGGLFEDEMPILSGSTDNLELLEQAIREAKDKPADWIPVFTKLRKERVLTARQKGI